MDTEESSATPSKRVKPTMGSEICVLETIDDVFNPAEARLGPSSTPNSDERFDVEDEVTHELHQMKALGRPYQAPTVSELMPKRDVYGTTSDELLEPRLVGDGRAKELWARGAFRDSTIGPEACHENCEGASSLRT